MKHIFQNDLFRYYNSSGQNIPIKTYPLELQYIYLMRKCQNLLAGEMNFVNRQIYKFYFYKLNKLSQKTQIQIPPQTSIGDGLYIGHTGRIIINGQARLGKNVNIATGVTIGAENRGKRKGSPTIENNVWIGTNAAVVGNVTIGHDVLIAPLTFVNFDVPSHSIVLGNPGVIIRKDNATEGYIDNCID